MNDQTRGLEPSLRRQITTQKCKNMVFNIIDEYSDGSREEADVIMLELAQYLIFSATTIQRNALLVKDLGLTVDETIEKLRHLEPPAEAFRGTRDV